MSSASTAAPTASARAGRPNATIGRALGLMLLNIAGAKPGEMDRSTQGNPAKFTFCFGENEEENPWTPYHVQRGFAPDRQRRDGDVGRRPAQSQRPRQHDRRRPADDLRRRHVDAGRQHGLRQGPDVRDHRPRACRDAEARRLHDREHPRGAVPALARPRLAHLQGEPGHLHQHRPQAGRRLVHHRPLAARHPHHRGRRAGQALGVHPVVRRHDRRLRAHRRISGPDERLVRLAGRR